MSKKFYKISSCIFHIPWRKCTHFLISGRLGHTKQLWNYSHRYIILRGQFKRHKISMTKLAEPYPKGLCYVLAWAACAELNILKLYCSLTSRCSYRRIGKAKNPGPRRHVHGVRQAHNLDNVQLSRLDTE